jgi:hypothetical protein
MQYLVENDFDGLVIAQCCNEVNNELARDAIIDVGF